MKPTTTPLSKVRLASLATNQVHHSHAVHSCRWTGGVRTSGTTWCTAAGTRRRSNTPVCVASKAAVRLVCNHQRGGATRLLDDAAVDVGHTRLHTREQLKVAPHAGCSICEGMLRVVQQIVVCGRAPDKRTDGNRVLQTTRLHTCMAVCAMRRHMSLAVLTRSIMKSIIECVAGAPAAMPEDSRPPELAPEEC